MIAGKPAIIALAYSLSVRLCCPGMGEMKRAEGREAAERRLQDRFASTLVIAAAIVAAVRLARDENISRSSPRLHSVVADCVALARLILSRVVGSG